jgi:hypothetical protein
MTDFERQHRYIVLKNKDIEAYLSSKERASLATLGLVLDACRQADGKPPLRTVVVEEDWPEYEVVWAMIEARMTGNAPPVPNRDDELYKALADLIDDLETRSKWNLDETQRVVDCGAGVYLRAKAALAAAKERLK